MRVCPQSVVGSFADLAFKFLLIGLALVLTLALASALLLWLWQRQRTQRKRVKRNKDQSGSKNKVHPVEEESYVSGLPGNHLANKAEGPFFVIPLERNGAPPNLSVNGGRTNGFSKFFQGSPAHSPKKSPKNGGQQPTPRLLLSGSPSPVNLNDMDYLDIEGAESPLDRLKTVVNVPEGVMTDSSGQSSPRSQSATKTTRNTQPNINHKNGEKNARKDSVRPAVMDQIHQLGHELEQKLTLRNRPFKITVNDEEEEEDGNKTAESPFGGGGGDHLFAPHESPLMMRRFVSTMEKVPESENEKIYGEFEILCQQAMCTLGPRSTSAQTPENIRKNRFYDILPFEFNRIKLRWANPAYGGTELSSDFVNASLIQSEDGALAYIAAQGPIGPEEAADGRRQNTIRDFWEMVWQEGVDCVVMLTQCQEGVKWKCARYWPECPGEREQLDPHLEVHFYCCTEDDICWQRELWVHRQGQPRRKVLQWQFKNWQDSAGPDQVESLLTFMEMVRQSDKRRPILVHCSAGVGRTGVFIALDQLLDRLAKEQPIDVQATVHRLRSQRTSMVQNADQYVALYEAIAMAIRRKSRSSG